MSDDFNLDYPAGDAELLRAEALGEPGNRRFRLVLVIDGETHILWMEKEQVQALALAIEQVSEVLPGEAVATWTDPGVFVDETTRNQFRVGRIELTFDERAGQMILAAHDINDEEMSGPPTLVARITRSLGHAMALQAADLMTKGRKRCPMCGAPMNPGEIHVCPEQNGHLPIQFDEDLLWADEGDL